ncbi:D-alanyl-D-alanine carboxypeptidase family protein [Paracoccus ravus]|uniref:D-alanyl-D-alanine carboxypeptidase family protein n=1 Tax=Paracoccus ravus TaxID=2447760 RepID=UPI00106E2F38|nr:D-alanyl-D-alanine carboxypeptidase family protein [Paracoccus ravus]
MSVAAAPFAAFVMDARSGKEIYAQNADTRLHPASLTKMMTLYMAFTAIERGQVRLDSKFTVTNHAAGQPPSKLGLKPGQRIELRYLIRAAAVKSANDAATAIGEGLAGSEPKFAAQMTAMARALGMRNTNFRNANGLTAEGHYSSARDMSLLGRRLFYDFPQYYSIFSRRSADAGIATVSSTNKRFLDAYEGADGIKTGYTRAAGFNLTASAKRGSKRIIATVLGGTSTAHRNSVMAQLLDAGFGSAPKNVREVRPATPDLLMVDRQVARRVQVARSEKVVPAAASAAQLSTSARPVSRASSATVLVTPAAIAAAVTKAQATARQSGSDTGARPIRKPGVPLTTASTKGSDDLGSPSTRPATRPEGDAASDTGSVSRPVPAPRRDQSASLARPATASLFLLSAAPPASENGIILTTADADDPATPEAMRVIRRDATGGADHAISLGRFASRTEAEQVLLRAGLQESASLGHAASHIDETRQGYEARFAGLSPEMARIACDRLAARHLSCTVDTP